MIPDKIFITEYNANVETGYFSRNKDDVFTQEYIRKDALMEWLDGKMTIEGATEGFVGGYDLALKDVINKLNSM